MSLALVAAGCSQPAAHDDRIAVARGRYAGIGTYDAGTLWAKMAVASAPKTAQTATTEDDQHVIVVVDSQTGEVRECGDYSGVCIASNPWPHGVAPEQAAPVTLRKHLADLRREEQQAEAETQAHVKKASSTAR